MLTLEPAPLDAGGAAVVVPPASPVVFRLCPRLLTVFLAPGELSSAGGVPLPSPPRSAAFISLCEREGWSGAWSHGTGPRSRGQGEVALV